MSLLWQRIDQKWVKPTGEGDDTQRQRDSSPPVLRAELQIPHAVTNRYEASQHENEARERERTRIDWWRLGVEIFTLVFAVAGFIVLYETWKTTREQLRLSERPWLLLDTAGIKRPAANVPVVVAGKFANSGHTPAFIIEINFTAMVSGSEVIPPDPMEYAIWGEQPNAVVPPEGHHPFVTADSTTTFSPEEIAKVLDGKSFLHVYGYVTYRDIFKTSHQSNFCMTYNYKTGLLGFSISTNPQCQGAD